MRGKEERRGMLCGSCGAGTGPALGGPRVQPRERGGGGARPCPAAPGVRGSGLGRTHTHGQTDRQTLTHTHTDPSRVGAWPPHPPRPWGQRSPGLGGTGGEGAGAAQHFPAPEKRRLHFREFVLVVEGLFFLLGVFFFPPCFVLSVIIMIFFSSPPSPRPLP